MVKLTLFLILSGVLLSSCETLRENAMQKCQSTSWHSQGIADAKAGKKFDDSDLTDCKNFGAKVDKNDYLAGYTEGAKRFCTFENGEKFAMDGNTYKDTCPPELERAFISGYNKGRLQREKINAETDRSNPIIVVPSSVSSTEKNNGQKCTFNSDCKIKDRCTFNKCKISKNSCHFDSDCSIEGRCQFDSCVWN